MDFPGIPITTNKELFEKTSRIGKQLIELHLLSSPLIETSRTGFPEVGTGMIERVRYDPDKSRVMINEKQWFSNIPAHVWKYDVGGYQICERWLLERLARKLNSYDQMTYMELVSVIKETIGLQQQMDSLYSEIESENLELRREKEQRTLPK